MSHDLENMVTGIITYKGIDFTFVFDREELRLIPPADKTRDVELWFMTELGGGAYTMGDPVYIEDPFLLGKCNEGYEIVLFPTRGHSVGRYNSVVIVEVEAYIWKRLSCDLIDRIGFQSPELDCIFPAKKAINSTIWAENGEYKIETKPFSEVTTEKQQFEVDGKQVWVYFGISMTTGGDYSKPPLVLHTEMYFEFEANSDYAFIFRLSNIAKGFIRFLCYRENVPFTSINLAAPYKDGKHMQFAKLHILTEQEETEPKCLKDRRYIRQEYISGSEGRILTDIAKGLLYTRNIPATYRQGRIIDAARFVMITAAFEWEFRRLYPDGIKKRQRTIDAENKAEEAIRVLYDNAKGKLREIFKSLLDNIRFTQLASKIIHTGKELGAVVDIFGKRLYSMNNQELDYSKMGPRLGKQRNNFAHGNLDQEFEGLALLDLIYLEMVIYAMQLKFYGIEDIKIQLAINKLFRQNIAINRPE